MVGMSNVINRVHAAFRTEVDPQAREALAQREPMAPGVRCSAGCAGAAR